MDILNNKNKWEPQTVTLEYEVYKKLLEQVVGYPEIIKKLTEDKTHVLVRSKTSNSNNEVYALITIEDFNQKRQLFI